MFSSPKFPLYWPAALGLLAALALACGSDGSTLPADSGPEVASDVGDETALDGGPDLDATDRGDAMDAIDGEIAADASADPDEGSGEPDVSGPLVINDLLVAENVANALSFFVTYTTDRPSVTRVDVVCDDGNVRALAGTDRVTEHEAFVMGLTLGSRCEVAVRAGQAVATVDFEVVDSPPGALTELALTVTDGTLVEPGWTLFNLFEAGTSTSAAVIVDEQGRYRWFHIQPGGWLETTALDEGVLLATFDSGVPRIVGWDGLAVWTGDFRMHHDMELSPFGPDRVLYLGRSRENCPENLLEGNVVELDMLTGERLWSWSPCGRFTPDVVYQGWTHLNTIEPVPGERALIISPRDQNVLFKVDRDSDEIVWTLGVDGDFEMDEADLFYHQHAPELQPDGNILLFDNGLPDGREISRAIELALTFSGEGQPESAEVVWEYVDETLYTPTAGDADRLPNGNTLITYGGIQSTNDSMLREVTGEGQVVWELSTPSRWAIYRADRIAPRYGFVTE